MRRVGDYISTLFGMFIILILMVKYSIIELIYTKGDLIGVMKLFIAICLIVIPLIIIMNEKPKLIKELNEFGYLTMKQFENRFEYLGGFKDVSAPKKFNLIFKENEMIFDFDNTSNKIINRENVLDSEIMTQSQIKNEISLGKILVFGILAWGMQKQKEEIQNYVVIEYREDGKKRSIVFKAACPERQVGYINIWRDDPILCKGKEVSESIKARL